MLAAVDKAAVCGNSQILGRSGELPLLNFFNRYLPVSLRAVTGFFVSPRGHLSPQIDILIVDSRYPLLAHNADGTVVTTLHSVVQAIEVKVSLAKREVIGIIQNAEIISGVSSEVFPVNSFSALRTQAIAYRTPLRITTLADHFFAGSHRLTDVTVLRVLPADNKAAPRALGTEFHWEPMQIRKGRATTWSKTVRPTLAPLSDIYYHLVQSGYYTLSARNFTFHHLGMQMNHYLTYGTFLPSALPGVCYFDQLLRNTAAEKMASGRGLKTERGS